MRYEIKCATSLFKLHIEHRWLGVKMLKELDMSWFNETAKHPEQWTKDEVVVWLKWCVEEYSIDHVPPDKFDMNGKALCLLKRSDFMERAPKNGDILYNALQKLAQKTAGGMLCPSLPSFPTTIIPPASVACVYPQHQQFSAPGENSSTQNGLVLLTPSSTAPTTPVFSAKPRPYVPILPQPVGVASKSEGCVSNVPGASPGSCGGDAESASDPDAASDTEAGVLSPAPSASDAESLSDNEENREMEQNNADLRMNYLGSIPSSVSSSNGNDVMPYLRIKQDSDCRLLWEFIHQLLQNPCYKEFVCWEKQDEYVFRINNPMGLAQLWGHQKNRSNMTYEKLSRALRYYYRMNIIKKVSGKRLTYKFMQPPSNIQKGQRGAKPHSKSCLPTPPFKQEIPESSASTNGDMEYDNIPTTVDRTMPHVYNGTSVLHRPLPILPTLDRSPIKTEVPNFCDYQSPGNEKYLLSPTTNKEFRRSPSEDEAHRPLSSPNLISAHAHSMPVKREPEAEEPQDFTMSTLKRKERLSQESDFRPNSVSPPAKNNESRLPLLLDFRKERSPVS